MTSISASASSRLCIAVPISILVIFAVPLASAAAFFAAQAAANGANGSSFLSALLVSCGAPGAAAPFGAPVALPGAGGFFVAVGEGVVLGVWLGARETTTGGVACVGAANPCGVSETGLSFGVFDAVASAVGLGVAASFVVSVGFPAVCFSTIEHVCVV